VVGVKKITSGRKFDREKKKKRKGGRKTTWGGETQES